jgi:hypothetical protein
MNELEYLFGLKTVHSVKLYKIMKLIDIPLMQSLILNNLNSFENLFLFSEIKNNKKTQRIMNFLDHFNCWFKIERDLYGISSIFLFGMKQNKELKGKFKFIIKEIQNINQNYQELLSYLKS